MPQVAFSGSGILLDVEGTTSSVRFVYDTLFPFARRELDEYLERCWQSDQMREVCRLLAQDAGFSAADAWFARHRAESGEQQKRVVRDEVLRLMDADVKATGLKQLQGLIWKTGFESGELKAHVYPEVPACLARWHEWGKDVRIYSSGSIAAQKLFFAHTQHGNLLPLLRGHYDTTTGPKKEAASYKKIAADWQLPPDEILFLSDVPAELDAARTAGFHTTLVCRPENDPVELGVSHPRLQTFEEIVFNSR